MINDDQVARIQRLWRLKEILFNIDAEVLIRAWLKDSSFQLDSICDSAEYEILTFADDLQERRSVPKIGGTD